jgi:hypothetical protein
MVVLLAGCTVEIGGRGGDDLEPSNAASMWRLTSAQYNNSIEDIFGSGLTLAPDALDVDESSELFLSIGASRAATSERGVSQYVDAALSLASRIVDRADQYDVLRDCAPTAATDPCVAAAIEHLGTRLWRRPLETDEVERYVTIVAQVIADAGTGADGLEYALAALIASPNFLYVAQVGEADGTGKLRYTSSEMASRLAYFLWDSTPDGDLLERAAAGDLVTDEAVADEVERMLGMPRARGLVSRFMDENWLVGKLVAGSKSDGVYDGWSDSLVASYRQEFALFLEDLVAREGDFRDVFVGRQTFMNSDLGAIYGVAAPAGELVATPLPPERTGLLTSPALIAANSPSYRTSPTLRGVFIVQRVLCEQVPEVPPDVNTSIEQPEPESNTTFRELLEQHSSDPACAGCHQAFDPPGFTFENFDTIGRYRTEENGQPIDSSGDFEGVTLEKVTDLAAFLRDDPRTARCLALRLFSFASGRQIPESATVVDDLAAAFATDHQFRRLVAGMVASPAFRYLPEEDR